MPAESKIIERIRKLLELADETRGGTEAERELALQRAQELMLKHNIEQGELTEQSAPGDVGDEFTEVKGATHQWKGPLQYDIGKVCFVDGYYSKLGKHHTRWTMVGRGDNIAFVKVLVQHLIPWLEQEARDGVKRDKPHNPKAYKRAFYSEATRIICMRLTALRRSALTVPPLEEGSGSGVSLDLIRNESLANREHIDRITGGGTVKSRARSYGNQEGRIAGAEAGSRADLTPGRKLNS